MSIQAVKELRERTGAGFLDCKNCLQEANGDIDQAIKLLEAKGEAKAAKKQNRSASEGLVTFVIEGQSACLFELNCETDFVTNNEVFRKFFDDFKACVIQANWPDLDTCLSAPCPFEPSMTVQETITKMTSRIGEKICLRRYQRIDTKHAIAGYQHGDKIGVLVVYEGDNQAAAKDVAIHISWAKPLALSEEGVPADFIAEHRDQYMQQAKSTGKPVEIQEKMVAGKLKKLMKEHTLLDQEFVKDAELSIRQFADKSKIKLVDFVRFELGDGVEKSQANLADEVKKILQSEDQ